MNIEKSLTYALDNNLNVILKGLHGTGKTSIVKQCFESRKLRYKYFSASTMDPWVDFIGVPKEKIDSNGNSTLELIRPREFQNDEVEAIFFDEFNRCISGNTEIALASGEMVPVKDLVGRSHFYVYAYDSMSSKIRIAKGHSARVTKKDEQTIRLSFDNGRSLVCTLDHPILMRDGTFKDASSIRVGESLMPLVRRDAPKNDSIPEYEQILQPGSGWCYTHRLADDYNLRHGIYSSSQGNTRHHIDLDKNNNSPENLVRMPWDKHLELHRSLSNEFSAMGGRAAHEKHPDLYNRTIGNLNVRKLAQENSKKSRQSTTYKQIRSDLSKRINGTPERRKEQAEYCRDGWKNGQFNNFDQKEAHTKRTKTIALNFALLILSKGIELSEKSYERERSYLKGSGNSPANVTKLNEIFGSFEVFKELVVANNHKVIAIEICEREDVYDITVDEYHNFAISSGIFVHNSHKKVRNGVMELLQFKSINGKKFNNLKVIWAAINPDDDTSVTYDVEKIDPAQLDRFQLHIDVPYKPSETWFDQTFGEAGILAIEWWNTQIETIKLLISPRRLEYAVRAFQTNGDLKDVLPSNKVSITSFTDYLSKGLPSNTLDKLLNVSKEEVQKFFSDHNNLNRVLTTISQNKKYADAFEGFIPLEQLLKGMTKKNKPSPALVKSVLDRIKDQPDTMKSILANKDAYSLSFRKKVNTIVTAVPAADVTQIKHSSDLQGKRMVVCLSGYFNYRRTTIKRVFQSVGIEVKTTVSSKVTHLFCGSSYNGTKRNQATTLSIPILDYNPACDFINIIMDPKFTAAKSTPIQTTFVFPTSVAPPNSDLVSIGTVG